jgi:outer membrane protein OmpA-like peptidoglycan-associated protein
MLIRFLGASKSIAKNAAKIACAWFLSASVAQAGAGAFKIKGYLSSGPEAKHVVIEAGRSSGVNSGEVFRAIRPARGGITSPVETGLLKVVAVHENESIAEVVQQGTAESEAILSPYSEIMAGDLALVQRITISAAKLLAPEVVIKYSSIFDDPKAQPSSYEFTPAGRNELRKIMGEFAVMKAGMLMIEGHTDQKGTAEQNQIESYQRALTVRQYLIDDLGFDESRVTAIGLGETEAISDVILPGNADRSRRIVLKVVPMPGAK